MRGSSQYDGQGGPGRASDNRGCVFRGHELGVSESNPRCAIAAAASSPIFLYRVAGIFRCRITGGPGRSSRGDHPGHSNPAHADIPATRPPHPGNRHRLPGSPRRTGRTKPRMSRLQDRELVVGITPFEEPNAALVVALARAGSLGVLDLGRDYDRAQAALAEVCRWWSGTFGVRLPIGCPLSPADLPSQVDVVVLDAGTGRPAAPGRRMFIEVTSVTQAHAAIRAGAWGLIAKGAEAGGRVGATSTFVLLQQLLGDPRIEIPIWAAGGIGPHTAAAAIAGGAAGVVLDGQLALVAEADLPTQVAAAIRAMDGTETAIIGGHRLFTR